MKNRPASKPSSRVVKCKHLRFGKGFAVAISTAQSQAATMVIAPGKSEGGPENYHTGSDQWLFVISGRGVAILNRKRHLVRSGSLLFIPKGIRHEIKNTARTNLKTLNFYVPAAYTHAGDPLPAGQPGK